MGQRNKLCTNQMTDFESGRHGQNYIRPENPASFTQPNLRTMASASDNAANVDAQFAVDHCDNVINHGMTQSINETQHHHNLGVAPATNFCCSESSDMTPSFGASSQLSSPSNYGVIGGSADEHGRNSHFRDDVRVPRERKYSEGISGSFQHGNSSSSFSSSVAPSNNRHPEGVVVIDSAPFALPEYRGPRFPSIIRVGHPSSLRNRSGFTGMDFLRFHDHTQLIQDNNTVQYIQPAGTLSLDQQLSSHPGYRGTSSWNQASATPYVHVITGSNVNGGSMDTRSIGMQRYHETAGSSSSPSFPHPPPINHRHHNHHHPNRPMQGVRGQNINSHPQVAAASYRIPTNPLRSALRPAHNSLEMGYRHLVSVQSTGLQIYHPHRRGFVPEATLRQHSLQHLRVLRADETAVIDLPEFYQVVNLMDHNRDTRLDVEEHVSYEELLALGEQIGNVSTGLSMEMITSQLRTKTYESFATINNLEEATCEDQEADLCVICQDEYKNQENIGLLDCGHGYHADCLKKWLLVRNVCPICKSEALTTGRKDA
ncbi:probable E3 ubiquitin-protein ligase ZFP1 [Juglans microcarpa x Juglans regia]|uniref:probable E3 ubiquitin-protein ligase ZFP1 n=1 Tax=Juglans microcarpa x Juglans regia TaxID=2249226 RepID=UPI001B7F6A4D|nr:probable E3 ubiquitin-protein ligase ZFP1 [Juglans microcarpa x Juglans regia]